MTNSASYQAPNFLDFAPFNKKATSMQAGVSVTELTISLSVNREF